MSTANNNIMDSDNTMPSAPEKRIVIVGAGITGLATAYYLQKKHNVSSLSIIEWTGEIAPGASGKAAGFLARKWNDGTPTQDLTYRSFDLHQELAYNDFGADKIDYRRVQCVGVQIDKRLSAWSQDKGKKCQRGTGTKSQQEKIANMLEWTKADNVKAVQDMGDESELAQVHPALLCEQLWKAVESKGGKLIKGRVVGALASTSGTSASDKKVQGVQLEDGTVVPADVVVYAAGPWVANIMYGIKGHSLVFETPQTWKQVVFFSGKNCGDPEVFVRPNNRAFRSGYAEDPARVGVDVMPGQEEIEKPKTDRLENSVRSCAGGNNEALGEVLIKQACYQPTTLDYLPVIGEVPSRAAGCTGCYMAGGNNCWGILLGPATGECMTDLIMTGMPAVDLSAFQPGRFRNLKPLDLDEEE